MWYPPKNRTDQLDNERSELERLQSGGEGTPEEFLTRISVCIQFLAKSHEIPLAYLRDWIWIGSQYRIRISEQSDAYRIARAYLIQFEKLATSVSFGTSASLADIHWITELAVTDLQSCLGLEQYNVFLSDDERDRVLSDLDSFQQNLAPFSADEEEELSRYIDLLSDVTSEVYHPVITGAIERLLEFAHSESVHNLLASASLRYLLKPDDVVPDDLGAIGLVDDIFAIEHALKKIENRETWEPLLNRLSSHWPFVDIVSFDDEQKVSRLPAFLRIAAGLALGSSKSETRKSCIILPDTGGIGLLLSFLASIESARTQLVETRSIKKNTFSLGDDILLGEGRNAV